MKRIVLFSVSLILGVMFVNDCAAADLVDEWVRYFEGRNILANNMLAKYDSLFDEAPPSVDAKAERPNLSSRMSCTVCDKRGEVVIQEPDYGQWKGQMLQKGRKDRILCPLCKGRKYWEAYWEPRELYAIVAKARNAFMIAHQSKGDIPVGQAFVPRDVHDGADRKQLKLVETTFGQPCPRCQWTGIEECKKCNGTGTMRCPNKRCKEGWIVIRASTSLPSQYYDWGLAAADLCDEETDDNAVSSIFATPQLPVSSCCSPKSSCKKSSCPPKGVYKSTTTVNIKAPRYTGRSDHTIEKRSGTSVDCCEECDGIGVVICKECQGRRAQHCSKCHGFGQKQK